MKYGRTHLMYADELKRRIRQVWNECANDLKTLRKAIKQFLLRLKAVEAKHGKSIKTVFGWRMFKNFAEILVYRCNLVKVSEWHPFETIF